MRQLIIVILRRRLHRGRTCLRSEYILLFSNFSAFKVNFLLQLFVTYPLLQIREMRRRVDVGGKARADAEAARAAAEDARGKTEEALEIERGPESNGAGTSGGDDDEDYGGGGLCFGGGGPKEG